MMKYSEMIRTQENMLCFCLESTASYVGITLTSSPTEVLLAATNSCARIRQTKQTNVEFILGCELGAVRSSFILAGAAYGGPTWTSPEKYKRKTPCQKGCLVLEISFRLRVVRDSLFWSFSNLRKKS